jgi:N-acetylmuramoyl-L-alanine amidase
MQVIQKFLPEDHPNRPKRTNNPIAVIVHYTGNSNPTATALANINYAGRKYIRKNGKTYEANGTTPFVYGAGHVYIDQNEAYQIVPYNEYVAGAGDARLSKDNGYNGQTKIAHEVFSHRQNYMSIQYEICNNGNWDKACDNAINIIAKDMIDYNIPMERVYRHHDLSGKICPKPFVDNPQAWEQFKTKLQNKIIELRDDNMFNDIQGHYAEKYIKAIEKTGLMVGDGKGKFNPDSLITRGQLAVVLAKLLHLPIEE